MNLVTGLDTSQNVVLRLLKDIATRPGSAKLKEGDLQITFK
jgi:hypothetical protein